MTVSTNEVPPRDQQPKVEEWQKEAGEGIFEPILDELQPNWDDDEPRVLDGPGAIADATLPGSVSAPLATESRRRQVKPPPKKDERRDVFDTLLLKKFVPVPVVALKKLWNCSLESRQIPSEESMNRATLQMQKVHKCMVDLRSCFTLSAAKKACLSLSVALLDLAATPACQDPLICLQQAAMYASQASKYGNSDVAYRRRIPSADACTPLEALVILGRADCLQSVFFPREAAFLCSFVARTCALHRDFFNSDHDWDDQWKVVGIYAHNVSIMIRTTVNCMINHSNYSRQTDFSSMWEQNVVKELEKGRMDARDALEMYLESRSMREEGNDDGQDDNPFRDAEKNRSSTGDVPQSTSEETLYDPEQLKDRVNRILASPCGKSSAEVDDKSDELPVNEVEV